MNITDMSAIYRFIRNCNELDLQIITNAVDEAKLSLKATQHMTRVIETIQTGNRLIALSRTGVASPHPLLATFYQDFERWLERKMLLNPEDFPRDWESASAASLKAEAQKILDCFIWVAIDVARENVSYPGNLETRSQAVLSALRCPGLVPELSRYISGDKELEGRPTEVFGV